MHYLISSLNVCTFLPDTIIKKDFLTCAIGAQVKHTKIDRGFYEKLKKKDTLRPMNFVGLLVLFCTFYEYLSTFCIFLICLTCAPRAQIRKTLIKIAPCSRSYIRSEAQFWVLGWIDLICFHRFFVCLFQICAKHCTL